jgi:hypothetical protein
MVAAMQKNNRMASRLVSKGADVFLIDKSGRTAMDHVKKGHNQVSYSSLFLLFIRCLIKSKRCFNNRCCDCQQVDALLVIIQCSMRILALTLICSYIIVEE